MVERDMLDRLDHKMQVRFAVFCARQVIDLVAEKDRPVCLQAIEAAEGFIEGKVSKEECRDAAYAAYAAADAANAAYAAYAAARAAYAAAYAANAATYAANAADAAAAAAYAAGHDIKKAIEQEQIRYYNELLNFDKIVEDLIGI